MKKSFTEVGESRIAHYDVGSGPPVLMIHGIPTSAYLWRRVIASMRRDCRCIAPDLLGLGDTEGPIDSDYSIPAQADRILGLLDAKGIPEVVVMGHDQGGGVAQVMAARHPDRISGLVLTNCVCYDNWPAPVIRALMIVARRPNLFHFIASSPLKDFWTKSSRVGYRSAMTHKRMLSDETIEEFSRPLKTSAEGLERFRRFALAGDSKHTMEAVGGLKRFRKPALIVWAEDDAHLGGIEWANRLKGDIPGARRIERLVGCGHFLPEERPRELARLVLRFLGEEGFIEPVDADVSAGKSADPNLASEQV